MTWSLKKVLVIYLLSAIGGLSLGYIGAPPVLSLLLAAILVLFFYLWSTEVAS